MESGYVVITLNLHVVNGPSTLIASYKLKRGDQTHRASYLIDWLTRKNGYKNGYKQYVYLIE